jgi:hypothetical protein
MRGEIKKFIGTFASILTDTRSSPVKYFIVSLLLFIGVNAFGQNGWLPLNERNEVHYADIGKFNTSTATLYRTTQNWISATFGNYENAVAFQDSASGKLVVSSYLPLNEHTLYQYVRFNLTINCDENGYRARIHELDGITPLHTATRISRKENLAVTVKELALKTETSAKKRSAVAREVELLKAGNESINVAMYHLLASLKVYMTENIE